MLPHITDDILIALITPKPMVETEYNSLFNALGETGSKVVRVHNPYSLSKYLKNNIPKAIIVADEGLAFQPMDSLMRRIVAYVKAGGRVIFGMMFPSHTPMDLFNKLFAEHFNLPWAHGDWYKEAIRHDVNFKFPEGAGRGKAELPKQFPMLAMHLKGVRPNEQMYFPVPGTAVSMEEEFSPIPGDTQDQVAVAGTQVGEGFLFYVGDVMSSFNLNRLILAMCGL